jgi:hypothetical protein
MIHGGDIMGVYIEKYVEVEVELEDFDTEELVEELERRQRRDNRGEYNLRLSIAGDLIDKIYHLRRQGKPYERELDEYLYQVTGRVL